MTFQKGFQGSETSRVEITVYPLASEFGLQKDTQKIVLNGPSYGGSEPVVVAVEVSKALGTPSGIFSIDIMADNVRAREVIFAISDDDWVDIVVTKHGVKSRAMRGSIDAVQRMKTVVNGATHSIYRIVGRDFGKIFELTPIWFDFLTDGTNGAGAQVRAFGVNHAFASDPAATVETILAAFLREFIKVGRSNWPLPESILADLRGATGQSSIDAAKFFVDHMAFFKRDFINYPVRRNQISQSVFEPFQGTVWEYAAEWSDPLLCELYIDLLDAFPRSGDSSAAAQGEPKDESTGFKSADASINPLDYLPALNDIGEPSLPLMSTADAVIFRDRPFPTVTRKTAAGVVEAIQDGPYFKKLTVYEIAPQHVTSINVSRSGLERRNAFVIAPKILQDFAGQYYALQFPLWSPTNMQQHGVRRMDTTTRYLPNPQDVTEFVSAYRERMRDFHGLNHLFWSGVVELGHGRPDIRIGHRLRIVADDPELTETYYTEMVRHTWSLASGVRTSVGITRGWIGDDASLQAAIYDNAANYETSKPASTVMSAPESVTQTPLIATDVDPSLIVQRSIDRVLTFRAQILAAAADFAVPAEIVASIMYCESRGRNVNSPDGHDHGLMQVNDVAWAPWPQQWEAGTLPGYVGLPRDETANIRKGAEILRSSLIAVQNLVPSLASGYPGNPPSPALLSAGIAAYNSGPGNVKRALQAGLLDEFYTIPNGTYRSRVQTVAVVIGGLLV